MVKRPSHVFDNVGRCFNSFDIVIRLRCRWSRDLSSSLGRSKAYSSSPHRLWDPLSLLSSGYRWSCLDSIGVNLILTIHCLCSADISKARSHTCMSSTSTCLHGILLNKHEETLHTHFRSYTWWYHILYYSLFPAFNFSRLSILVDLFESLLPANKYYP